MRGCVNMMGKCICHRTFLMKINTSKNVYMLVSTHKAVVNFHFSKL